MGRLWNRMESVIISFNEIPIFDSKMRSLIHAEINVNVRQNMKCTVTFFSLPRRIEGMTDERTNIQAKLCMKFIMSILERSQMPKLGIKLFKKPIIVDIDTCVNIW
jgi:hypothetical protein